jgi:ABC-type glycerol-3-phosphate transport system substrate-binding protein
MQAGMALRTPTYRLRLIMQVTLHRIAMKISVLAAVILASALSGPIVSAQEKSTATKSAMTMTMTMPMDIDKQMRQILANIKEKEKYYGNTYSRID